MRHLALGSAERNHHLGITIEQARGFCTRFRLPLISKSITIRLAQKRQDMDIGLLNILRIGATASWDFRFDMAQGYAMALRNAIELHVADGTKKHECFFLSLKGTQTARGNFEDRLYVGDVRYVENHLRWNDEELAEDDKIVNVIVIDRPVTRDGGACSYGTKDFRNQIIYANTIPQVVAHIFVCNTPGGESACRNDYDEMFASCRANNKKTVQYVDGMCGSSGVNLGCRCDRVIVRNPKDDYGCIGSMAAFWATPDGAVDHNGTRYVEVVGDKSPNKNDWYREAAQGDYEKLKAIVNRDTEEFQQTVRENRPNVKEEHLTGTVFEAQEVLGSLVDEINNHFIELEPTTSFSLSKEALSYAIASRITRNERLILLNLLAKRMKVNIYSWEKHDLLQNVNYMGSADYYDQMPKIFKTSRINLNITLKISQSGIPLRVMDILGSGGFLLSNSNRNWLSILQTERMLFCMRASRMHMKRQCSMLKMMI